MFSVEDCFSHLASLSTGATQTLDKLAPSYHIPENKHFANAQTTIISPDLKCHKCFTQFSTSSDLDRHMNALHSEQSQEKPLEGSNVQQLTASNHNDSATVNIPLVNISKAKKLSKTKLKKQKIQCKLCSFTFNRNDSYKRHSRTAHCKEVNIDKQGIHTFTDLAAELEEFTCSYCKKSFSRKHSLNRHIETKHGDDDIKSDIAVDAGKTVLDTINKDKLICKMCDSEFREFQVYKRHCRTVHRKLVEIDKNGQHELSEDSVEHTVPYCLQCGKTFSSINSLDTHMNSLHKAHSQEVPNEQWNVEHFSVSIQNEFSSENTLLDNSCEAEKCSKTTLEQTFQGKFKVEQIVNHSNHTITGVAVLLEDTTCSYCKHYFSCEKDLKSHIETKHAGDDIETDIALDTGTKVLKTINQDKLTCKMCDFAFCEFRVYQQHCRTVHSKKVKVDKHGQQTFADFTKATISCGKETISCGKTTISCGKATISCGKEMSSDNSVDRHIKRNSAHKKSIKCTQAATIAENNNDEEDVIPSSFRELHDYKHHCRKAHCKIVHIDTKGQHKFTHFKEPTVPYCLPCDSTFSTVRHLNRHTQTSSAHKKTIKSTQAYTSDDNKDDEEDSESANKRFVNNSVTRQRLKKNPLEQTFQCKFCSTSFTKKQSYKSHNRNVHFKEVQIDDNGNHTFTDIAVEREDITCSYCKKTFLCNRYLKQHIRKIHSGIEMKINKKKLMCKICDSSFRDLQDYKHHYRKVHCKIIEIDTKGQHKFTHFEKPTAPYCLPCGLTFSTVSNLNKHTQKSVAHTKAIKGTQDASSDDDTDDEEDMLPYCIPCSKTFKTIKSLQLHQATKIHHQTVRLSNNNGVGTTKHRCPLCSRIYANTKELKVHLRCHHRNYYMKNKLELFPKEYTYGTIPTCEICEKEFDKYYNLKKHTLTVHNESFDMNCLYCNKAFTSIARLKKHTKYHIRKTPDLQKRTEEIKCTICNKVSSCPAKHEHHISVIHHGTALWTCSICKMAIRKPGLKNHMKRHRQNSRLKCYECKIQLGNHLSLMKHKENHVYKDNPFKCNVCFKTFTNQSNLKMHMYVHNANYIPLHCKMCDRKFYDQRILDKHMKKHAKGDPIICSYCGKQFIQDKNLQAHITQKHLNEKPYVCEVCGKAFQLPLTLKRHALVHTREKAFQCPICYQKFSQQASVKRHMVVHSGEKPYKCQYCDKRYSQTTYLHVHVKNHH